MRYVVMIVEPFYARESRTTQATGAQDDQRVRRTYMLPQQQLRKWRVWAVVTALTSFRPSRVRGTVLVRVVHEGTGQ